MYRICISKSNIEMIDNLGLTEHATDNIINTAEAIYYKPASKFVAAIVDPTDKNEPVIREIVDWKDADDAITEYTNAMGVQHYPIYLQS